MKKKILLKNCVIADRTLFIKNGSLLIEDGSISKISADSDSIKPDVNETDIFDLQGRLLLPGLTNPHTHLYSSLATGLSPLSTPRNFSEILSNYWWPLDKVHDEQSVYYSAVAGILDAVKHGVTCIFDHHASMSFVKGSLDVIKKAVKLAGIKAVLCYETSGRYGMDKVPSHVEENLDFLQRHTHDSHIKGMLGFHANFTLSNSALAETAEVISKYLGEIPIHIHCGEDKADLDFCLESGYYGPVDRLNRYRLINSKSILAHCVHLSHKDYEILHEVKPHIVTNPESNANNRVGKMDRSVLPFFTLGTDGMSFDMIASLRSMYLLGRGYTEDMKKLHDTFFGETAKLVQDYFPSSGTLEEGKDADIAVLDYIPQTEINADNLIGHLIFGSKGGNTYMTIARGNILYSSGNINFTYESSLRTEIRKAAADLHRRYYG